MRPAPYCTCLSTEEKYLCPDELQCFEEWLEARYPKPQMFDGSRDGDDV